MQQIIGFPKRYPRACICVVLSVVFAVMIYLRLQELPVLREQEESDNRKLDVMLRNQSQGAELGEQLTELKRMTAGLANRQMVADDKASNLQFFYNIESKSRASITELRQMAQDAGDGSLRPKLTEFTGLGFNVSVSGRVAYVMSFLKRMENGKYFVRCNSAVLKGNKTLGPDAVDVVLRLEVLSKKP